MFSQLAGNERLGELEQTLLPIDQGEGNGDLFQTHSLD
jgi:hypothetical protein